MSLNSSACVERMGATCSLATISLDRALVAVLAARKEITRSLDRANDWVKNLSMKSHSATRLQRLTSFELREGRS